MRGAQHPVYPRPVIRRKLQRLGRSKIFAQLIFTDGHRNTTFNYLAKPLPNRNVTLHKLLASARMPEIN
jgi:hypothetical protein